MPLHTCCLSETLLFYKTSSQPALVYMTTIDINNIKNEYIFEVIGHSHWSGANGQLYTDLSTITTALNIVEKVKAYIITNN